MLTILPLRRFFAACAFLGAGFLLGAEQPPIQTNPTHIGSREIVLEFSLDSAGNPTAIKIVSSESHALNKWAAGLTQAGAVKPGSPGVKPIGDNRYRASISFPIEQDGDPLAADFTGPTPKFQAQPKYPFELRRKGVTGGALIALTIDKNAKLTKVTVLRASHPEFGEEAREAVLKWRFGKPATKQGKPIEMTLNVMITFELDGLPMAPWQWCVAPAPCFEQFLVTGAQLPK